MRREGGRRAQHRYSSNRARDKRCSTRPYTALQQTGCSLGLASSLVHWKEGMRTQGGHLEGVGEGLCCETDSLLGGPASHLMVDLLKCIQRFS